MSFGARLFRIRAMIGRPLIISFDFGGPENIGRIPNNPF